MIKTTPFKHQQTAIDFGKDKDRVVLWLGIGAGKSLGSLYLCEEWKSKRILVVCPTSVITTWRQEIGKHTDWSFDELVGNTEDRVEKFLQSNAKVQCINWPGLKYLFGEKGEDGYEFNEERFIQAKYDCLILDECHNCMNYKALQSRIVTLLSKITPKCIMLTGTPISGNELDLWNQYYVLDGGKTLGHNFFAYRNAHFEGKLHKSRDRLWKEWRLKGEEERQKIIDKISISTLHLGIKDCIDLPEVIRETRYIDLSTKQSKVIESIKEDIAIELADDKVLSNSIRNKAIKIAQISGGTLLDGGEIHIFSKNPKLLELEDLLKEIDEKVIIFHAFVAEGREIENLCKRNKWKYASLRSEIKDKNQEIELFQNDPSVKVLIAHPQSGGEGLNLQMARIGIFYSLGFTGHLKRQQAEGRIYRAGQNKSCIFIDLVAKNSMDEHILKVQGAKRSISDAILEFISR